MKKSRLNYLIKKDRIKRISSFENVSEEKAKDLMENRDKARIQYFNKVFGIQDPDNRFNYHAVLNTSSMSFDMATDIIVDLAKDLHLDN